MAQRIAISVALAIAGSGVCVPVAAAAGGTRTLACSYTGQAIGRFADVYRDAGSVAVGPLALVGMRGVTTVPEDTVERVGGFKSPLLLRPGRRAILRIDRSVRASVRLAYGGGDRRDLQHLPHTLRLKACTGSRARSRAGGDRVTFWPGVFAFKPGTPCLRFSISARGKREQIVLPVAGGSCAAASSAADSRRPRWLTPSRSVWAAGSRSTFARFPGKSSA